jgi:ABC-type dipeptide/oligopeptide/nickel transport system permease subunit
MRVTDLFLSIPFLVILIIAATALGGSVFDIVVILSLFFWMPDARIVRGVFLSLKEKEFVEAARSVGASNVRIIVRHLLPNALGPIIVAAAFIVPGAIIAEAVLTYLGIGLRPDVSLDAPFPTSWGQMIQSGQTAYRNQPWLLIAPSLAVALITLSFTFVGDGLRDALDPRDQV